MGNKYYFSYISDWPGGFVVSRFGFCIFKSIVGCIRLDSEASKASNRFIPMFILMNIIAYGIFF